MVGTHAGNVPTLTTRFGLDESASLCSRLCERPHPDAQCHEQYQGEHAWPQGHGVPINENLGAKNQAPQLRQGHQCVDGTGHSQSNDPGFHAVLLDLTMNVTGEQKRYFFAGPVCEAVKGRPALARSPPALGNHYPTLAFTRGKRGRIYFPTIAQTKQINPPLRDLSPFISFSSSTAQ